MTTRQPVPLEVLFRKEGFVHVRFLATDLPPVGYKCFEIRSGVKPFEPETTMSPTIENQYYRVTMDSRSGAIQSIFDKQLQRELVDQNSPYKFGQYLYVTGGDGQTRIINPFKSLPLPKLTEHPAENGKYLGTRKTPWGYSIRTHNAGENTPADRSRSTPLRPAKTN